MAGISRPKSARRVTFARFVPLVLTLALAGGCGKSGGAAPAGGAAGAAPSASAGGDGPGAAPPAATRYRVRLAQPHIRHRHAGPR